MDKLLSGQQYRDLLSSVGLKTTQPRLALLKLLSQAKTPLSPQKLCDDTKKLGIDQATIYRNLQTLTQAGLIHRVNFQHDHNHYELATSSHHHHAICEQCGKVVDISKCDIQSLEKQVKTVSGFAQINHHALEFFGLCNQCAKKSKVSRKAKK